MSDPDFFNGNQPLQQLIVKLYPDETLANRSYGEN